jgi:hypothetical protein
LPQHLPAYALIAQGVTLARLGYTEKAERTLARAIEAALQIGDFEKAGLAALTMIEELDQLPPEALIKAYEMASSWLAENASFELLLRVNNAAKKMLISLGGRIDPEEALEILLAKSC